MTDPADIRFFKALSAATALAEGLPRACRQAIERAVETGSPEDMRTARQHFDALAPAMKDSLMRQVHRAMATDLSAIWDMMSGAKDQRPN